MNTKGRWTDWVALAAGVLLVIGWVWHGTGGAGGAFLFLAGMLIVLASIMSITRPQMMAGEGFVFAFGALAFLAPWMMALPPAAAWTGWILGGAAMLAALAGVVQLARRAPGAPGGRLAAH
ncbi:hypothetical protein [Nocardiopsis coralliicola]